MAKQLKKWQGWLLFGGAMVIVFVLGLICSSLLERRAEVASIFNNRRVQMTDSIVSQNEKFAEDCNVLELVDNFGFLISFFIDKFIC